MPFRYEEELRMGLNSLPECVVELEGANISFTSGGVS